MARPERDLHQAVWGILKELRGTDPLKQLFWSELNYQRVNQSLPRRGWGETATKALAEDPVLLASGGSDSAFHAIYARLDSPDLRLGLERPVVSRLLKDHPYSLFVFSNDCQDRWHFVNVKYGEDPDKRRLFRRISDGVAEGGAWIDQDARGPRHHHGRHQPCSASLSKGESASRGNSKGFPVGMCPPISSV